MNEKLENGNNDSEKCTMCQYLREQLLSISLESIEREKQIAKLEEEVNYMKNKIFELKLNKNNFFNLNNQKK